LPPRRIILTALALRQRLHQLADALVPPEVCLVDITTGMAATQIAAAIARLGIADVLADRPMTAVQVAERVGTHAAATHRLVRSAVSYGLCRMNPKTGTVALTRTGKVLRSDHPHTFGNWAIYMASRSNAQAWSDLAHSVRTGHSAFEAVHGMSIWEWLASHPEEEQLFVASMNAEDGSGQDTSAFPLRPGRRPRNPLRCG
jgi:hypothetical protein